VAKKIVLALVGLIILIVGIVTCAVPSLDDGVEIILGAGLLLSGVGGVIKTFFRGKKS